MSADEPTITSLPEGIHSIVNKLVENEGPASRSLWPWSG